MEKENIFPYIFLVLIVGVIGFFVFMMMPKNQNNDNKEQAQEQKKDIKIIKEDNMTQLDPSTHKLDENKKYTAIIKTDLGDIKIELNTKEVPFTANNFIYLAKQKFYDGVIFHRTIEGFMIQGGDPTGTGAGGPGYKFADEPFKGQYTRGTIAMANAGPNTNGSQFFIMHEDYPLPPNYVIFGKVVDGIKVVDAIATAPTEAGGEGSSPVNPVKMKTVEIIEE